MKVASKQRIHKNLQKELHLSFVVNTQQCPIRNLHQKINQKKGHRGQVVPGHKQLMAPIKPILPMVPPLLSGPNKLLAMNSEELLNILTYYHLQEFSSGRELLQALEEDNYARNLIAPAGGIKRSTFFDTVNDRGVETKGVRPH